MNTSRLGNIGEAKLLWEFVKKQIPVYTQFGDSEKVDIVADFNGKLNRIQVKTSEKVNDGRISWNIKGTTLVKGKLVNHKYTKEEVDYFGLYNLETDLLLLIPIESITCQTSITFTYPFVYCKTASANHNWEDYTLDKILSSDV